MSVKQVPGGPTVADTRRFATPPVGSGVSGKYTTSNNPANAGTNEFPVVPFAPDKYDTIASIKQAVGANDNDAFGQKWMVPFTDADAQYMLRQQSQVANANYERWLWDQYDLSDPAQAWIFQQIAPEQFEKRKQLILYNQNLATKYAMLRLYGVKTEEDLMLKFLVETRQIELPKGPVWEPRLWMARQNGFDTVAEYEAEGMESWMSRYTAGMFSPMKYVNQQQVGYQPDSKNRQDPLHNNGRKKNWQIFAGGNMWKAPYQSYGLRPTGEGGWISDIPQAYRKVNHGIGMDKRDLGDVIRAGAAEEAGEAGEE